MRIITGTARGRKLKEPAGQDIRPTADSVKESIFNIVQFDVEGRRVLDLFAGTGQLGIEALSRGALSCVFVDESREAVQLVRENLERCGFRGQQVVTGDALSFLRRGERFDLIIADPPYGSGLAVKAVEIAKEFDILSKGGIIVCETDRDCLVPPLFDDCRVYRYGKIKLTVLRKA